MTEAMTLNMSVFSAMETEEMYVVEGGTKEAAAGVLIIGGAIVAGILAPLTCGGSLAAYASVALAGYTAMGTGAALLIPW